MSCIFVGGPTDFCLVGALYFLKEKVCNCCKDNIDLKIVIFIYFFLDAMSSAVNVVSGEVQLGSQYHFFLENMVSSSYKIIF